MKKLTHEQREMIHRLEGYYGELGMYESISCQEDIERKIRSIKQGLYMLLSDNTLDEFQYSEAQGVVTELGNTILTPPTSN